jgi:hypothetical protein
MSDLSDEKENDRVMRILGNEEFREMLGVLLKERAGEIVNSM